MRHWMFAVALIAGMLPGSTRASDGPIVVVIRHAERQNDSESSPLSKAGHARAEALVTALERFQLTAIITSGRLRTKETAGPIAKKLKIDPVPIGTEAKEQDPKEVVEAIGKHTGAVLVVGHTFTVPKIVQLLGGPDIGSIPGSVYDNMLIIIPAKDGPRFIRARYGAPSK